MRYRPLRHNSEFGRVYARGKAYVDHALVLYVLKTRAKQTRVGLTATKKVGCAVQRNRARRVMKAAIDEHLDYNIGGYNLIFVARGGHPPGSRAGRCPARWPGCSGRQDCRTRPCAPTRRPPPAVRPAARPAGAGGRRAMMRLRQACRDALCVPHTAVQAVHQPGPRAQLPLYPPPAANTPSRPYRSTAASKAAAGGLAHFALQSFWALGLRPGARTGALEKSRPGAAPAPRPPAIGWNPDRQNELLVTARQL